MSLQDMLDAGELEAFIRAAMRLERAERELWRWLNTEDGAIEVALGGRCAVLRKMDELRTDELEPSGQ